MTNKERQRSLDKIKWKESEKAGKDQSGDMSYCVYCSKRTSNRTCLAEQKDRESECLCAKAFNRMRRA